MSQQPPSQGSNIVVMSDSPEPNMLLRVVWFVFVGWWLSFWAIVLATVLQLTIIGIPGAIWVINRIPQIMTLKSSRRLQVSNNDSGVTVIGYSDREQRRWWVRAIYYVLVGWWATFRMVIIALDSRDIDNHSPHQFLDVWANRKGSNVAPVEHLELGLFAASVGPWTPPMMRYSQPW